jgi:DNA-nicking Smr family endonuclease
LKKGRNQGNKGDDTQGLWERVTQSVKPYSPGRMAPKKPVLPVRKAAPAPLAPVHPPAPQTAPPKGFDRATETKLRRGQLPLEGWLDLHGMTQQEAFEALHGFISACIAQGKRTVLIITGKGKMSGGVLKQKLPLWLEEPSLRRHIIAVTPAQPKDGGSGAFYLRLRKPQ